MGTIEREIEAWAKSTLPVYEFMELSVASVSDGVYQCHVPLTKNTGNHIGTVHAAFQWASAEILGGLVVFTQRCEKKYLPVVRSLDIHFKRPAVSNITSEAFFPREAVEKMNSALAASGRYDFELKSTIRDSNGEIVAEATGSYAIRTMEAAH